MSNEFDYEAADDLLGEWFPDQLMDDDPEFWHSMIEQLLECGSREAAVLWLQRGSDHTEGET